MGNAYRVAPDDTVRGFIGARPYGPFASLRQGKEVACRCENRRTCVLGELGPVCLSAKAARVGDVMAIEASWEEGGLWAGCAGWALI